MLRCTSLSHSPFLKGHMFLVDLYLFDISNSFNFYHGASSIVLSISAFSLVFILPRKK